MLPTLLRTFGKGPAFVLLFLLLPTTTTDLWCKTPPSSRRKATESARASISVYNDAEVPADVVARAEEQASRIFQHAAIEVTWLNCRIPAVSEEASGACREVVFPEHLHLRIVRKPLSLKGETMGISFQAEDGSGCYADLFYEPMEQLHQTDGVDIASLLGHVAAHEIGHLLLGTNSHSAAGIMHARWTSQDLANAKAGGLIFSEQESLRMRAKLATVTQASKEAQSGPAEAAVPSRAGN